MMNLTSFPPQKILLIEPPFYTLFGYERFHYPMTLTMVGTHLKKQGHDVAIHDGDLPTTACRQYTRTETGDNYHRYGEALDRPDHPAWQDIRKVIREVKPSVIGLTAITAKIESADRCARIAREEGVTKVILGGPHVAGMLTSHPGYSFGEDYDSVVAHIPGLVSYQPDKSLLMRRSEYRPKHFCSIMTSAGCPCHCSFCCHSFEKTITYRGLESICSEFDEILDEFGPVPVYIVDDCFLSNTSHFDRVGAALKQRGMTFSSGARIMALTPEKVQRFMGYGGTHIYIGVESGSQAVLDRIQKRLKIEEVIRRTKWLNEAGLTWNAFFIAGFPFETLGDIQATRELIGIIQPSFVSLNRCTPYPGTELYNEHYRGRPLPFRDLYQLNSHSCLKLPGEIEHGIADLFQFADTYNETHKKTRTT